MNALSPIQPRWGSADRDRKASAIWETLRTHCGEDIGARRWLDVGCGSGGITAALARQVWKITGVDPEPWSAWDEATARNSNLHLLPGVFDGDTLPIAAGSIDVAICNQVYEHVGNPMQLIGNLNRTLAPGGVCYFAGPNLLWPVEPHVQWPFVHWLPRSLAQKLMSALGFARAHELDAYSTHCWKLRRWCTDSGFLVENALRARLVAGLRIAGFDRVAALVGWLPQLAFVMVEPIAPGLVYVLRKSSHAPGAPRA